jgi:hypothetical protein
MAVSELSEHGLRAAARRAYERGRLGGALLRGAGATLIALPTYWACNATPAAALCVAGLAVVIAVCRYRGLGWNEGARMGLLAGLLPCLLPACVRIVDPILCDALFGKWPWICALGGLAAGAILGWRGRNAADFAYWASALTALAFAAGLGCIPGGVMGLVGLVAGVAAGAAPALLARRSLA